MVEKGFELRAQKAVSCSSTCAPTSIQRQGSGNTSNTSELLDILKDYQVHIFAGHTHFYENAQPAANIYEHNIGAACGAWWAGHVEPCGAPNGLPYSRVDDKKREMALQSYRETL